MVHRIVDVTAERPWQDAVVGNKHGRVFIAPVLGASLTFAPFAADGGGRGVLACLDGCPWNSSSFRVLNPSACDISVRSTAPSNETSRHEDCVRAWAKGKPCLQRGRRIVGVRSRAACHAERRGPCCDPYAKRDICLGKGSPGLGQRKLGQAAWVGG